ncbi:MFS transporter [Leptospira idonii]|uniref:MFS transporter n=1 Tax=Leptospira idonii TaxID=1193500 RepID=A0A4R9M045_9LEPT|nr:MFS transporter [Leptospira idonii]TGN20074.1 MFS transporter [Leptospira idonii]
MNLFLYYLAFAIGTLAGSSFLYTVVIFCQSFSLNKGFSGLVFFFLFLPFPLLFLGTGYLLDRFSKKWVLFLFQGLHFLAAFFLFLFHDWVLAHPYSLFAIAFLNGIGMTTVLPGRMAILRDIAPHNRLVLHTISGNLLLILFFGINPLLIGFFREHAGFSTIFLWLALTHAVSMLLILLVRVSEAVSSSERPKFDLRDVVHFFFSDTVSRQVLYVTILSMIALGPIQVLLPLYVKEILHLGELERGSVLFTLGLGLFFGGVLSLILHKSERKGLILLSMCLLASLFFWGFFPWEIPWVTSFFLFLFGITGGVLSSLLPSILQKRAEDRLRGRVLSLYMVCFQFTPAVSGFLSALLGEALGIHGAFWAFGGFLVSASLISFFLYSELRRT